MIKKNIIVSAVIGALVASIVLMIAGVVGGNNQPQFGAIGTRFLHGLGIGSVSMNVVDGYLQASSTTLLTGATTIYGSSTIAASFDGTFVGGTFTISTTSPSTLYTNTFSPQICDSSTAALYAKNNGSFAPSLNFSVGTSTGSIPTLNLLATTTIASTTTTFVPAIKSGFILGSGHKIMGLIGDVMTTGASSTYYGNWSAEFGVSCRLLSI